MAHKQLSRIVLPTLAVLLCGGCLPVQVEPVVLHENPEEATERYAVAPLLVELGDVLETASTAGEMSFSGSMRLSDLENAHLPDAVVQNMGVYLSLLSEVAVGVRTLNKGIEELGEALRVGDIEVASDTLLRCEAVLVELEGELPELLDASRGMLSSLRRERGLVSSADLSAMEDRVARAHGILEALLQRYGAHLGESRALHELGQSLEEPKLELLVPNRAVWVGQPVHVSGCLAVGNEPLGGQEVEFLVDGVVSDTAVTDADGCFVHAVSTPAIFKSSCLLTCRFIPQPEDASRLRGTTSDAKVITLRFHESTVDCSADTTLFPGLVGQLSGRIGSLGPQQGRSVHVMLGDAILGFTTSNQRGEFFCSFAVPSDLEPGRYRQVVRVEGDESQSIAPAAFAQTVSVKRLSPTITIPSRPIVFVPGLVGDKEDELGLALDGGAMTLRGTVESPLPMSSPAVLLEWEDWAASGQIAGQTLELVARPARLPWAVGPQVMTISVAPVEAWHRPSEVQLEFFVVNLYVLGGGVAILCVLVVLVTLFRSWRGITVRPSAVQQATASSRRIVVQRPVDGLEYVGSRQLVVRFYYYAVRLLERATGVADLPEMTLREFGVAVQQRSSGFVRLFGRLTQLAEGSLYGADETSPLQIRLAKRLSLAIKSRVDDSNAGTVEGESR